MTLESIVRPFAAPPPLASQRIATVVTSGDAPGPAILSWGKAGDVPGGAQIPDEIDPFGDVSFNTICCKDEFEQKAKKKETKRIDASDGSGFFVEFERPTELEFKKKDNECSRGKVPDIVSAPIAGLFLPSGQPVYSVTDNRANKACSSKFTYSYDDKAA